MQDKEETDSLIINATEIANEAVTYFYNKKANPAYVALGFLMAAAAMARKGGFVPEGKFLEAAKDMWDNARIEKVENVQ